MIFAIFEEKTIKGSDRFRVISAFKSRENRSLAEIGGRCRHLAETTGPIDGPTSVSHSCSLETLHAALTVSEILTLLEVTKRTGSGIQQWVAPHSRSNMTSR
jgi:hypothetical protein